MSSVIVTTSFFPMPHIVRHRQPRSTSEPAQRLGSHSMVRGEDREVPPRAVRDIDMPRPSARGGRTGGMQRLGVRAQTCDLIFERWRPLVRAELAGQPYLRALAASVGDGDGRQY